MARDARELRGAWTTFQSHWYGDPPAELAPFVSRYWAAEWDLRGQPPYRQKIVPYPNVHLTLRDGDALIRGPERGHVVRVLEGHGLVFGVTFRPGCFRPFLGASVSTITGRTLAASTVFGPDLPTITPDDRPAARPQKADTSPGGRPHPTRGLSDARPPEVHGLPGARSQEANTSPGGRSREARGPSDARPQEAPAPQPGTAEPETMARPAAEVQAFENRARSIAAQLDTFLLARLPDPDPLAERAAAIVAQIQAQPHLTRVDALARSAGLGVRRLQRLFADYVGLSPKRVIRRYRLHEVGERLASGEDFDWAGLADQLGYADQAHFVRDFTAMVGESPTRYAERYPGPDPRRRDRHH